MTDSTAAPAVVITPQMREMMSDLRRKVEKAKPMMAQIEKGELKVLSDAQQRQKDNYPIWTKNLELLMKGEMPPKAVAPVAAAAVSGAFGNQKKAAAADEAAEEESTAAAADSASASTPARPTKKAATAASPSPAGKSNKNKAGGDPSSSPAPHSINKKIATSGLYTTPDGEVIEIPKDISNLVKKLVELPKKVQTALIDTFVKKQLDNTKLSAITKEYDDLCKLRRDIMVGKIEAPSRVQESRLKLIDIVKKELSLETERLKAQGEKIKLTIRIEYEERMELLFPQREASDEDEAEAEEIVAKKEEEKKDEGAAPTTAADLLLSAAATAADEEGNAEAAVADVAVTDDVAAAANANADVSSVEDASAGEESAVVVATKAEVEAEVKPPTPAPEAAPVVAPTAAESSSDSSSEDEEEPAKPAAAAGGDDDEDDFGFDLFDPVAAAKDAKKKAKEEKKLAKEKAAADAEAATKKAAAGPEAVEEAAAAPTIEEDAEEAVVAAAPIVPEEPPAPKEIDWSLLKVIRNRISLHQKVITAEDRERLRRDDELNHAAEMDIGKRGASSNGRGGKHLRSASSRAGGAADSMNNSASDAPVVNPFQITPTTIDDEAVARLLEKGKAADKTKKGKGGGSAAADQNSGNSTKKGGGGKPSAAAGGGKLSSSLLPPSSAAAISNIHATVVARVQRDLLLCLQNPLANVRIAPSPDSALQWFVNVSPTQGPMMGVIVPLLIQFGELYPQQPPLVRSLVAIPHPSIVPSDLYRDSLCFEHTTAGNWSPAHGVFSILSQLQSFFNEENFTKIKESLKGGQGTFKQRIAVARADCSRHVNAEIGHYPSHPFPPLPVFNGPFEAKATLRPQQAQYVGSSSSSPTDADANGDASEKNSKSQQQKGGGGGKNNKSSNGKNKKAAALAPRGEVLQGPGSASWLHSYANKGVHTFAVHLCSDSPKMIVGVAAPNGATGDRVGNDEYGWGLNTADMTLRYKGKAITASSSSSSAAAASGGKQKDSNSNVSPSPDDDDSYSAGESPASPPADAATMMGVSTSSTTGTSATAAAANGVTNADLKNGDSIIFTLNFDKKTISIALKKLNKRDTSLVTSPNASTSDVPPPPFAGLESSAAVLSSAANHNNSNNGGALFTIISLYDGVQMPADLDALVPTLQLSDRSMVTLELNIHTKSLVEFEQKISAQLAAMANSNNSAGTPNAAGGVGGHHPRSSSASAVHRQLRSASAAAGVTSITTPTQTSGPGALPSAADEATANISADVIVVEAARKPVRCVMTLATPEEANIGVVVNVGRDPKTFMPTTISFKESEYVTIAAFPLFKPKRGGMLVGRRREALIVLPINKSHATRNFEKIKESITTLCRNPDAATAYTPPFKPVNVWPVVTRAIQSVLEEPAEDRSLVNRFESFVQLVHLMSTFNNAANVSSNKSNAAAAAATIRSTLLKDASAFALTAAASAASSSSTIAGSIGAAGALFAVSADGKKQFEEYIVSLFKSTDKSAADVFNALTRSKKKLIITAVVFTVLARKDAEEALRVISETPSAALSAADDASSAVFEGLCALDGTFTDTTFLQLQPLLDDVSSSFDGMLKILA